MSSVSFTSNAFGVCKLRRRPYEYVNSGENGSQARPSEERERVDIFSASLLTEEYDELRNVEIDG